ncbi:MAG: hypothetical protein L3J23_05930 [Flavobacteriaceae bacterium]|nr:hypothetical protein [Flavobacteriaceae bacterium]
MKKFKYMGLILLTVIFFIACYIYYLSIQRDTKVWTKEVEVAENIKIPIEFMTSQKKYYGGHAFGWGGGDYTGYIKFNYKGIFYDDNAPHTPIVIKYYKENFYIVYFDRETDFHKIMFRFFKSQTEGNFKEINRNQFPKHLAIQNRWFKKGSASKDILKQLDISRMGNSLTAKIWYYLKTGINYHESPYYVPENLLKEYKKENFTDLVE